MSPSWRDQLHISLSPNHIALQRLGKGFRPKATASLSIPCPKEPGKDPWCSALAVLEGLLRQPEWQHADATVILSNIFARFQLLPWNEHISGAEELRSFAQHRMATVYGDSSAWDLRIAEGNPGTESLACGIPLRLLEALSACCAKNHVRLRSLQPYLMTAYNRARRELARGSICFAAAETGRVCFMRIEQGAWKSVHCRSLKPGDALGSLVDVLERERQLSGMAGQNERTLLYAPGITPASLSAAAPKQWQLAAAGDAAAPDWRIDFSLVPTASAAA